MNQYTETNELEQMRSQLNVLKQKLEQQQIVNDQLIRRAMQQKMSWIRKYVIGEIIAIPIVILCVWGLHLIMGFSVGLSLAWTVLLVASVTSDWFINRTDPKDFLSENLTSTTKKLIRMKTLRRRYEMAALPLAIVLLAWMCWEGLQNGMSVMAHGFVVGGLIGGTIGGCIGFSVYRKFQKTNDEIIRQIAEMTAE